MLHCCTEARAGMRSKYIPFLLLLMKVLTKSSSCIRSGSTRAKERRVWPLCTSSADV
jgi:hypothetical protein